MSIEYSIPEDELDELATYKNIFPAAIPLAFNATEHPLERKLCDVYGGAFFLIYSPMGILNPGEFYKDKPFHLFLLKNACALEKYSNFFFGMSTDFLTKEKVKCFGECSILMSQTDDSFKNYRNAVAIAFKNGNPFKNCERPDLTFFFDGKNLIETENFMRFSDGVLNDFRKEWGCDL